MKITFCGHSNYIGNDGDEQRLLEYLENTVGDAPVELYLGGYGRFDSFALGCGRKYKKKHPNTKLIFVTPYLTPEYQKNHLEYAKIEYDEIVYPPLENVPLKFAISHRNKWMVENADIVIAYVSHSYGGAYQTYIHAKRKKKPIFNLSDKEF